MQKSKINNYFKDLKHTLIKNYINYITIKTKAIIKTRKT